jgi:nucleoside-diphosphate-sugar epimerase
MTSTPTQAMLAAARGEPFHITFGGTTQYHYALDVARCIVATSEQLREGARVHNLPGPPTDMATMVAAIEAAVPDAAGTITFEPQPLPFPPVLESSGGVPFEITPLEEGVAGTIAHFRESARRDGSAVPG